MLHIIRCRICAKLQISTQSTYRFTVYCITSRQKGSRMNPYDIIDKYYGDNPPLRELLVLHSRLVTEKALAIAARHPELNINTTFVSEAGMLHDIGIYLTDAPAIHCHGKEPYLCHGILGAELMRKEGFPLHARVCERHTGAGLTIKDIEEQNLPLPHHDFLPETIEEQLICYADKFYSKTRPTEEKTPERALASLRKFGEEGAARFEKWLKIFE